MGNVYKVIAPASLLGSSPILEQAISAAKGYAASMGKEIVVIEEADARTIRGIRFFPDGHTEQTDTPFVRARKRMFAEFSAEVDALGLKADKSCTGGMYRDDEFFVEFVTEPEPMKGNKSKIESLKAAGYHVNVYVPLRWNGQRGFNVVVSRKLVVTEADKELWK